MPRKYHSTSDSNQLKRIFGANMPLLDATVNLKITVKPSDLKGAKPKSAVCCGIAKAAGGTDVAIFRSIAYFKEQEGRRTVIRKYANGEDARAFIRMFDGTRNGFKLAAPMTVTFLPVPPSHTQKAMAQRHAQKRVTYSKTSKRAKTVTVNRGKRMVILDRSRNCAARYQEV